LEMMRLWTLESLPKIDKTISILIGFSRPPGEPSRASIRPYELGGHSNNMRCRLLLLLLLVVGLALAARGAQNFLAVVYTLVKYLGGVYLAASRFFWPERVGVFWRS
jgi:hypothetical protein